MRHTLFGGSVTFRSDVLSGLTGGPLQHGAFTLFTLAVGVAAALGLAVMLLELALGASERDSTLARLATMGLGEGQRAWVVALEVLPAVIAAAVAAWACAVTLPRVLAPDINLSVFTGTSDPGAAGGQRRVGRGTALRPRIGRCGVARHRDKVGTPTRRGVPSGRRMNGRTR